MVNMPASLGPEDESLEEGWAPEDSDSDAAYVDRPTVRSHLLYTPIKNSLNGDRSGEDALLEKEERKTTMGALRARYTEARLSRLSLSNPCLISSHRNMPP